MFLKIYLKKFVGLQYICNKKDSEKIFITLKIKC